MTFPSSSILPSSLNILWGQIDSFTAVRRATYSSIHDVATDLCCLELHKIAAPLIVARKPQMDFPSSLFPAQSASLYTANFSLPSVLPLKAIPLFRDPFRYRSPLLTTALWILVGAALNCKVCWIAWARSGLVQSIAYILLRTMLWYYV
jgi:hypothetical protein